MQKVVGSSPIIRSKKPCTCGGAVVWTVNGAHRVAAVAGRDVPCRLNFRRASWDQRWKPWARKSRKSAELSPPAAHEQDADRLREPSRGGRQRRLQKVMCATAQVVEGRFGFAL